MVVVILLVAVVAATHSFSNILINSPTFYEFI